MERGQRYLNDGNLQKAQIEFRNAMQIAPGRADARVMSGRVAEKLGNYRDAVALYQSAVDAEPNNVVARARLGRLLALGGLPDRALEVIAPALQTSPQDPDLLTVRGAAHAALKQDSLAITDAELAVHLAPGNEDAVSLLAALYERGGDHVRAVSLLGTTLQQQPESTVLRQVLADLYEKAGQSDAAGSELERIVVLKPRSFASRVNLVNFYVRSGKLDAAERILKQGIEIQPDNEQAKLAYVEFLTAKRSREAGEKALDELLARNPADLDLKLARAAMLQQGQQQTAAEAAYRDIIARAPDTPQSMVARDRFAAILVSERQFEEASSLLAQVLLKSDHDADALRLRAMTALERGETGAAITDLRTVQRDQPHSGTVIRELAKAYIADGQSALAEESLTRGAEAVPEDTGLQIELAQLLARTNRLPAAVSSLQDVVSQHPHDLDAQVVLIRMLIAKPDLPAAQMRTDTFSAGATTDWRGPYLQGLIAEARQQPADAVRRFEQALVLRPDAMDVLEEVSKLQSNSGHLDQAIARVQASADRTPNDAPTHNLLGQLRYTAHDTRLAIEELTRASQLAPAWWTPYHNLGAVQMGSGDVEAAIRTYEQGVKATRMESALVIDLTAAYERAGRFDDAIRAYQDYCSAFPGITFAANNLAMLLVTYSKDPSALIRARELTQRFATSTNADFLDTAGWVRLKSGDVPAALAMLEDAARRQPASPIVQYHLGIAQIQAGQRDRARASLQSALAGNVHFAGWDDARSALAKLGS